MGVGSGETFTGGNGCGGAGGGEKVSSSAVSKAGKGGKPLNPLLAGSGKAVVFLFKSS